MDHYLAQPLSRFALRQIAKEIRRMFGLENEVRFPVLRVLELISGYLVTLQIVDDDELPPNVHAETDVTHRVIKIKNCVYEGAFRGSGRDLMTIAHEMCHFWLICIFGVRFQQFKGSRQVKPYESPEWQAKCLAGELMIDKDLVHGWSVSKVAEECGVSEKAAAYQMRIYAEEEF